MLPDRSAEFTHVISEVSLVKIAVVLESPIADEENLEIAALVICHNFWDDLACHIYFPPNTYGVRVSHHLEPFRKRTA